MESKTTILENPLYQNPQQSFTEVIDRLDLSADLKIELNQYLKTVLSADNVKGDDYQTQISPILERMLQEGKREEAGLVFNIHRILTEFRGYGANDKASSDVEACFGERFEIPKDGVIVIDFFATRNLPAAITLLEKRGVDLSRIRVCVPKGIMAAQLMNMGEAKRREFEEACTKLDDSQFIIEDVNHNGDINLDEDVAIWFSPRTMPINPELQAETETKTIENYRKAFRRKALQMVEGGRMYANLAYSDDWKKLQVERTQAKRRLAKLTGISKSVAVAISKLLTEELGFKMRGKEEFNPVDVDGKIDHSKLAKELHVERAGV